MGTNRTRNLFTLVSLVVLPALLVAWAPASGLTVAQAQPPVTRIEFSPGGTSAEVQGQLAAGASHTCEVHLSAHQLVQVSLLSKQVVWLEVLGADGTLLETPGAPGFAGYVPSTQDYLLKLTAGGTASSYTLQVIVPARISFAPGGTLTTVQGVVQSQAPGHYIVMVSAGQTLKVTAKAGQGQVTLEIRGLCGPVMLSDKAGATSFSGTVPTTQDYLIDVESVGSHSAVFGVTVTIPPAAPTPPCSAGHPQ